MLHGRVAERAAIATLLDEVWASRGETLVLRGQPGVLLVATAARCATP